MANQGTLKAFNEKRGFGFITCEGVDYFFHKSDIKGKPPQDGDVVTFDMSKKKNNNKVPKVKNVMVHSTLDPKVCPQICEQGWADAAESDWCCRQCCRDRVHPGYDHNCGNAHYFSV
jgi:cold shock CspA family protein